MERLYKYTEITDLKDMLKKSGQKYGKNIAYKIRVEEGKYKTFTHEQIRKMIDGLGTALIDMGLKDKRIAIIGENRYEWEISYLSIVCGTGIVVPLDKSLPENELESLLKRSEVEAIICSGKYVDTLKKIRTKKLKYIISIDLEKTDGEILSQKELIEKGMKLVENGDKRFIEAKIDNEKMSIMLFTSGTTSLSKAVALSHKNICSNLMDIASTLDVNSNDIFLSFLPLHHVFECTVGFLFPLYIGAQIVFSDGIRHIPENLKEYKASVMASVPAIYERLFKIVRKQIEKSGELEQILAKEEKNKNDTIEKKKEIFKDIHNMFGGNIKLFISGAASLDAKIEEKFRNLGFNIVQGYGLTETSPIVAVGNNKYHKIGSIGKAVPSVEAKLLNVNEHGIGELAVKGPNVMIEYYNNKEATNKVLKNGWFSTGDLARIDEEGYIFICGRKKNVIVLKNGKNIYPEEMESLINKEDGIDESFIFGKPISDDPTNIKIYVKVVYNKEFFAGMSKEEITKEINKKISAINKVMPRYKAIRGTIISDEPLIKTTTNKIKREKNLEVILGKEDSFQNLQ